MKQEKWFCDFCCEEKNIDKSVQQLFHIKVKNSHWEICENCLELLMNKIGQLRKKE